MAAMDVDMTEMQTPGPVSGTGAHERDVLGEILSAMSLIDLSVTQKDVRHVSRALRIASLLKKKISPEILENAQKRASSFRKSEREIQLFLAYLKGFPSTPFGMDNNNYEYVLPLVNAAVHDNRRTSDLLVSKLVFQYFVHWEKQTETEKTRFDMVSYLFSMLRTAALRHDDYNVSLCLNLALRTLIHAKKFEAAERLSSRLEFPESRTGSSQFTRYLYYMGHIKAVQLDYSTAVDVLQQALRKAPMMRALGFRLAVSKLLVLVMLLIGDVPEKSLFVGSLGQALDPYLQLTKAVRVGDVKAFVAAVQQHAAAFERDGVSSLVQRLRFNVIKTGLRRLNVAYSRISFQDIRSKLGLENEEDVISVEMMVAKAIRDGVVDAECVHADDQNAVGFMKSKDVVDVYATQDPMQAYHRRITYCLEVHNKAVRAMRFPDDAQARGLQDAAELSRKLREEEDLLLEAMEDEDDF
eukprot:ANDGO_05856.mRNA.1 26S proteasome non-ATPase regulatory subunit 3